MFTRVNRSLGGVLTAALAMLCWGDVALAQSASTVVVRPSAAQTLLGYGNAAPEASLDAAGARAGDADRARAGQTDADVEESEEDIPLYQDFSRYIRETTGRLVVDALPIKRSGTRAPKLPEAYVLGAGDQIEIQVWGSLNKQMRLTLDDSGRIFVPEVGSVPLTGVRANELSSVLAGQFRRIYKGFELRASVSKARAVTIDVRGQARAVGPKTVSATHTVLSATLTAAAPSPGGSRRYLEFQRGSAPAKRIDLYCFFRTECPPLPESLRDGDVLRVPVRGKLVGIGGSVARPGIYELADNETADDLIAYAGGLTMLGDPSRLQVYSFNLGGAGERRMRTAALPSMCAPGSAPSASCKAMQDGDYVDVQPRIPMVTGSVTVIASGADPIRFQFRPGMRLLDVLSAPMDALVPRRTLGDVNAGSYGVLSELDERLRPLDLDAVTLYRLDRNTREYSALQVSYLAARANASGAANVEIQDGDVLVVDDANDWKVRRGELRMSVRVLGEIAKPGRYRFVGNKTLGEVLDMAGGLTPDSAPWSAVILRQGDGRSSLNREVLDRALSAVREQQARQEQVNSDRAALAAPNTRTATPSLRLANSRTQAEIESLLQGRDVIYVAAGSGQQLSQMRLSPNDVVIVPQVQDTFVCQGAFFRPGEFFVGTSNAIAFKDATSRCGVVDEMSPNVYHFIARENRVCRPGWMASCPDVASGDMLVAVPEPIRKQGLPAVIEWLDVALRGLTTLATVKVLSQ